MTLPDLIAALEAADAGSRELDDKIATAIWGEPHPMGNAGEPKTLYWEMSPGFYRSVSPCFTESLDAAITLLPEGWRAWFSWGCGFGDAGLMRPEESTIGRGWTATGCPERMSAPTTPLALCVVALRARLAEGR